MAQFLSPGHYHAEAAPGIIGISGVPVGTVALLGPTERGPVQATKVTSFAEFLRVFGGSKAGSYVRQAAYLVWRNHPGAQVIVQRVLHYTDPADPATLTAATAAVTLQDRQATPDDTLRVEAASPGAWGNSLSVVIEDDGPGAFRLTVKEAGATQEVFAGLSMDPAAERYAPEYVNRKSYLVRLSDMGSAASGSARLPQAGTYGLTGGSDGGALTDADYIGNRGAATGVYGFDRFPDEGLLIAAPGQTSRAVLEALDRYAAERFDSFVIFDPPRGSRYNHVVDFVRNTLALSTDFSAIYWPWVWTTDPATGRQVLVPPSGAVLGAHARTDADPNLGPWKVAAGIEDGQLVGVVGLETDDVNRKTVRDAIYPYGVNPVIFKPRYGILAYGARTLATSDKQHRYINQRRTFNYVAKSIDVNTQWVEFENNDESLWRRLSRSIEGFLNRVWRAGGLVGSTPQLAYVVKIDAENNPPSAQREGILTADIGLATQTPAEFVFFRYRKHTLAQELEAAAAAGGGGGQRG